MSLKEDIFRKEFLKTKHPDEIMTLSERYPGFKLDKDMIKHFNEIAKKFSSGETPENHSDPREAFIKR